MIAHLGDDLVHDAAVRVAASGPVESPLKRIAPTRQNEHNGADVRKATDHDG
jgi:hypothetical protein